MSNQTELKKVLFFTPFIAGIGGVEKTAHEIKQACKERGMPFELYTLFERESPSDSKFIATKSIWFTISRLLLGGTFTVFLWTYLALKKNTRLAATFDNTVIIVRNAPMAYAILKLNNKLKLNAKVVYLPSHYSYDIYSPIIALTKARKDYLNYFKNCINQYSEALFERKLLVTPQLNIVTFSHNLANRLTSNYQTASKDMFSVIRPGISPYILDVGATNRSQQEPLNFVYVGRVEDGKNLDLLLNYLKTSAHQNYRLRVIGSGAQLKRLKAQYQSDKVFFTGPQHGEALAQEYAKANYLILPTFNESYGHVISESLCVGTPVIGFSFNECNNAILELITPGENGLIITANTQTAFDETVEQAIAQRTHFAVTATKIASCSRAEFCWKLFLNKLFAI